ncbi:MAG: hypothetical protein V7L23_16075 [Nostoc sp.]|uniref:hypothetical protein n=1 Tax=Nostoc sp. TaxID=1180 RepID=UPI002FEE7713
MLKACACAGEQGSRGAGEQGSRGAEEQGSRGAGEQGRVTTLKSKWPRMLPKSPKSIYSKFSSHKR